MQYNHNVFGNLKLLLLILVMQSENGFQQQTVGCHHRPQNKNKPCQQQASSLFSLLQIIFTALENLHNYFLPLFFQWIPQPKQWKNRVGIQPQMCVSNVLREKQKRAYVEAGRNHIKYAYMMRAYLILCKTRHFQVPQTLQ